MKTIQHQVCMHAFSAVLLSTLLAAGDHLNLAGEWRFELPAKKTETPPPVFSRKIHLPGTMDDAGLGPKNTEAPTLEGPWRLYNYAGPAWYQRDLEIPAGWEGKRVALFLERCRWVTTVWLDDRKIDSQDSLIAPHLHDLGTEVKPGKHHLTICVDNSEPVYLGRFVSTLRGGTWGNMNGIVGRIELVSTPPVWVDDVQVYPDLDKKIARVVVKIGNATGKAGHGVLKVGENTIKATWNEKGGRAESNLDMSAAKLWDEFSPNLNQVTVKLGDSARTVSFGMRKFVARGTQFAMNDRSLFLRGTLECSVFPLTGYPPTDVPAWQRIYRIMKSYGLNHIRFHSWCPPEAAFAAADIEGIMIQAEGPMANADAGKEPKRDAFIEAEFKRIVDTYGNHPSFCTMTLGNEYVGPPELLSRWVGMLIERDPRHLYSTASSPQIEVTENRQWTEKSDGRGIHGPGTARDLTKVVEGEPRPIIGHEIGQWMYYPDFNEIKKWNGVMALKNFELIRDDMEKKHLLELAPEYVQANGKQATLLYKEEIEVLLRTPGYGGFSLLDLHDYPTQGTATVGPLDAFWDSKGFVTPEGFRQYCGATVPLLRMSKRTFTNQEQFAASLDLAHYGPADFKNVQPVWNIKDQSGREIASGQLPALTVKTGALASLGAINAPLTSVSKPSKLTVTASLQGTEFSNSWEIWVYPAKAEPQVPAGVVLCNEWDDTAKQALAEGKSVFISATTFQNSLPGKFLPVFWSPVWFASQKPNTMGLLCDPKHPALAHFPTEFYSNWQWYDIIDHSQSLILDDVPAGFRPIIQIMDNFQRNHKLGILFEARVGKGKMLFSSMDLKSSQNNRPAARQMQASLYDYLASEQFQPTQEFSVETLDKMLRSSALVRLGAKVIQVDSQASGYPATNAIDNHPGEIWHTKFQPSADPMPHQIMIDLNRELSLKGITYRPRQDTDVGRVAKCAVYCSNDSSIWGEPVGTATLKNTTDMQTIQFKQPVKGRYVKFEILSEVHGGPVAAVAGLDVIPADP